MYIVSALVSPCVADVDCALCRESNKRTLLLLLVLINTCHYCQCTAELKVQELYLLDLPNSHLYAVLQSRHTTFVPEWNCSLILAYVVFLTFA